MRWVHMDSDVGIWSISDGICHLFWYINCSFWTNPLAFLLFSASFKHLVLPPCKLLYYHTNFWLGENDGCEVLKKLPRHTQLKMNMDIKPDVFVDLLVLDMHAYAAMCQAAFIYNPKNEGSSKTFQNHLLKSNEHKLPSTTLNKIKTKDIPTPLSQMFGLPHFLCRFFLVGQELESALVAQLQKDAVAFSAGNTQNGMGWFGLKTMLWWFGWWVCWVICRPTTKRLKEMGLFFHEKLWDICVWRPFEVWFINFNLFKNLQTCLFVWESLIHLHNPRLHRGIGILIHTKKSQVISWAPGWVIRPTII